jgi:hypothetical protein
VIKTATSALAIVLLAAAPAACSSERARADQSAANATTAALPVETTTASPASCAARSAAQVAQTFATAFDRGDLAQIETLVAPTPGFRFISTAKTGPVYERTTALAAIATMKASGEVIGPTQIDQPVPATALEDGVMVSYGTRGRIKVVIDCRTGLIIALAWDRSESADRCSLGPC